MDTLKYIKLEFNGIKNTITSYSSQGHIGNFVNGLKVALSNNNLEEIRFFLDSLIKWYDDNIQKIRSNSMVFNLEDHTRNMELLAFFKEQFKDYVMKDTIMLTNNDKDQPLIFISHKSDDKKYGDALEKFIAGLGVKNEQLIYTSHPLHKIPLDKNIYQYLREHINDKVFMIILWSDEYLESPACLNEMGAAWVTQCDYTNIYVPTFSFGNPKYRQCAVDTNKMGAVLNGDAHCKANMLELKDKVCSLFNQDIPEKEFVFLLDSFIVEIKKIYNDSK